MFYYILISAFCWFLKIGSVEKLHDVNNVKFTNVLCSNLLSITMFLMA